MNDARTGENLSLEGMRTVLVPEEHMQKPETGARVPRRTAWGLMCL